MGKAPCCDKDGVRKGAWTPEEDEALVQYIKKHGHGSWRTLPKQAGAAASFFTELFFPACSSLLCVSFSFSFILDLGGRGKPERLKKLSENLKLGKRVYGLLRCGKSCRLRWINYLRPDIKRGPFTTEEESTIIQLHGMLGNRWAAIASQLPGRTDNEIKNYWNTHLKKRLLRSGHALGAHHSSFSHQSNVKSESPSTRHMVQWESARVEAEARLSMESSLLNSWSTSKTSPDYFLQLWHSDVGQSFRMIKGKEVECQSPVSQTSSSSKLASSSDVSLPVKNTGTSGCADIAKEQESSCKPKPEDITAGSVSISGSYDFLYNSDSALKLLLDMPDGDIEFLEGQTDSFLSPLDGRCE